MGLRDLFRAKRKQEEYIELDQLRERAKPKGYVTLRGHLNVFEEQDRAAHMERIAQFKAEQKQKNSARREKAKILREAGEGYKAEQKRIKEERREKFKKGVEKVKGFMRKVSERQKKVRAVRGIYRNPFQGGANNSPFAKVSVNNSPFAKYNK